MIWMVLVAMVVLPLTLFVGILILLMLTWQSWQSRRKRTPLFPTSDYCLNEAERALFCYQYRLKQKQNGQTPLDDQL